jgi:hypothetical protein
VPRDSHVRIPFYVLTRQGLGTISFHNALTGQTEEVITPNMGVIQEENWTIGVIGSVSVELPKGAWDKERNVRAPSVVHLTQPTFPPEVRGFDGLEAIVWSDPDWSELTTARTEALMQWVHEGGRLVIVPGKRWRTLEHAPFRAILPAVPVECAQVEDWMWLESSERLPPLGRGSHWRLSDTTDHSLFQHGQVGFGDVTILAIDPGEPPFRDWAGIRDFWHRRLDGRGMEDTAFIRTRVHAQGDASSFWPLFQKYSGVQTISFGMILLFLCLYVLVIGPLDYFALKRFDRLEWTWLTFPLAVAVAVGAATWWAVSAKGTKYLSNSVTVVDLAPGRAAGRAHEWVGMLTPRAGRLTIRCPQKDGFVLSGGDDRSGIRSEARIVETSAGAELELPTTQWGSSLFYTRFTTGDMGALRFRRLISVDPLARIVNDTSCSFARAYVLFEGNVYPLYEGLKKGAALTIPHTGGKPLFSTDPGFWRGWPETPSPFGAGSGHYESERDFIDQDGRFVFGTGDPLVYGTFLRYQHLLDVRPLGGSSFAILEPVAFHIPGLPSPGNALFIGWTTDLKSSFVIDGVRIQRTHFGLVRALLEPEAPE